MSMPTSSPSSYSASLPMPTPIPPPATTTTTTTTGDGLFDDDPWRYDGDPAVMQRVLWSCVCRNGVILAEAGGDNDADGSVASAARGLLNRPVTAGWEYHNPSSSMNAIRRNLNKLPKGVSFRRNKNHSKNGNDNNNHFGAVDRGEEYKPQLKGIKFHLHESYAPDDLQQYDGFVNFAPAAAAEAEEGDSSMNNGGKRKSRAGGAGNNGVRVWVFAAVYDANLTDRLQVQSFLEKIVVITDVFRGSDEVGDRDWKTGGTLSCQMSFAPILLQRMQEVTYLGKMAMINDRLQHTRDMMESNINAILENEDRLSRLQEQSSQLEEAAQVFKKRAKYVRKMKMMQNAKHGVILGTAVTAGVAIIVVPPLVALL